MATLLPGPFTVEMYHKLGELGIFDEDDRVELLDGQIVEMTPIGGPHAACVYRLNNLLARRTGGDVGVSAQNPVVLDPRWEPQPDIAILRRPGGFHGEWVATARDVALVGDRNPVPVGQKKPCQTGRKTFGSLRDAAHQQELSRLGRSGRLLGGSFAEDEK